MKRTLYLNTTFAFLLALCPFFHLLLGQTAQQNLSATILIKDSLFWVAYVEKAEDAMSINPEGVK